MTACSPAVILIVPAGLSLQFRQGVELGLDFVEARADRNEQTLAGLGRRHAARAAGQQPKAQRASRRRMVWLSADCETPSLAAARVKLRSRATARKATDR